MTGINRISSISELPDFRAVITADNGHVPLSREQQRNLVAVECANRECVVIANMQKDIRADINSLYERLKAKGYGKCTTYSADQGVIGSVYVAEVGSDVTDSNMPATAAQEMLDDLLRKAVYSNSSDIHMVSNHGSGKMYLYLRVHGERIRIGDWDCEKGEAFARAMYTSMSKDRECSEDSTGWNGRAQQDAKVYRVVDGMSLNVRYSHAPLSDGVHIVLRVLHNGSEEKHKSLEQLGFEKEHAKLLMFALSRPGMIVLVGETGSGKSTTIAKLLEQYSRTHEGRVVLTAEAPPEYVIHGVLQSPSGKRTEKNREPMPSLIRSMVRRDPDVMMVGEVRDESTAKTVTWATQSGHPIVTTTHAGSPIGAVSRFEGLGISRTTMKSPGFLNVLVYQRLLPVLCPSCSVPFDSALSGGLVSRGLLERLRRVAADRDMSTIRVRGNGCPECGIVGGMLGNNSTDIGQRKAVGGIVGRTVCAEMIMPDHKMLELIGDNRDLDAMRHWRQHVGVDGYVLGQSALRHAISKMFNGMISPHDVEKAFTSLDMDTVMDEGVTGAAELKRMLSD